MENAPSLIFAFEFRPFVGGVNPVFDDDRLLKRPPAEDMARVMNIHVTNRGAKNNWLVAYTTPQTAPLVRSWLEEQRLVGAVFPESQIVFVENSGARNFEYARIGASVAVDSSLGLMKKADWPALCRRVVVSGIRNERTYFERERRALEAAELHFCTNWSSVLPHLFNI